VRADEALLARLEDDLLGLSGPLEDCPESAEVSFDPLARMALARGLSTDGGGQGVPLDVGRLRQRWRVATDAHALVGSVTVLRVGRGEDEREAQLGARAVGDRERRVDGGSM